MASTAVLTPNPRRVAAGRRNRLRRKGLTPEGRERLRLAAVANRPWIHSTGPRTAAGKARVALNGKKRIQLGHLSVRERWHELAAARQAVLQLAACRRMVSLKASTSH